MRDTALLPIDPLTARHGGGYADELVEVRRVGTGRQHAPTPPAGTLRPITRTPHFALFQHGDRILVEHDLNADNIDEDLTSLLRHELFDAGWVGGGEFFERIFTGVVVSTTDRPADAWERFYRNSLSRIAACLAPYDVACCAARGAASGGRMSGASGGAPDGLSSDRYIAPPGAGGHDPAPVADGPVGSVIAEHAPLYARAIDLVRGETVLELGCCFGFLSLLLARLGFTVAAVDLSPGTAHLVAGMAARLRLRVETLACDAARVPRPDGVADTVMAIHLLEHLGPGHRIGVLDEALRLARRRVVVAVPFEEVAQGLFGHVQTLTATDLVDWGRLSRLPFRVEEFHGGWLVIDVA